MNIFLLTTSLLLIQLSPIQGKDVTTEEMADYSVKQDVFSRNLVVKNPRTRDIIRESRTFYFNTTLRRFTGDVLGYITPWNQNGMTSASVFLGKFTMISPVWFTLPGGNASIYKLPTNNVEEIWLRGIRQSKKTKNLSTKIVPRVLFENWSADDMTGLFSSKEKQKQVIKALVDTAKVYGFAGYVLELWIQFVVTSRDPLSVINFIQVIAHELRNNNLDTILAIPPSRGPKVQLFSKNHFDQLSPYLKAFSLMTYDYSSIQHPGPNSPLDWARECVELLVPEPGPKRSQILLGLNFYGYKYTPQGGNAILGSEYVKNLETIKKKIQWDDTSKEHYLEVKSPEGSGIIFYPTLYSILQRLDLADQLGTGISIWELGQGLNYFFDLL